MKVYRIVKSEKRANDLSGMGAFKVGGRWNSPGVYALYTSENRSLASLEVLVHVDESELPPDLYIITIDLVDDAPIYGVQDEELPQDWRDPENIALKVHGDKIFNENKFLGIKVRSAVMPEEYNYILNPLYPGFHDMVKIEAIAAFTVDKRLRTKSDS